MSTMTKLSEISTRSFHTIVAAAAIVGVSILEMGYVVREDPASTGLPTTSPFEIVQLPVMSALLLSGYAIPLWMGYVAKTLPAMLGIASLAQFFIMLQFLATGTDHSMTFGFLALNALAYGGFAAVTGHKQYQEWKYPQPISEQQRMANARRMKQLNKFAKITILTTLAAICVGLVTGFVMMLIAYNNSL